MPELPEVEIIRRELSLPLLGERIVDIEIDDKKIQIHSMDILNKVITDLIRKGKYLFESFFRILRIRDSLPTQ
jgi:formamidopyrimidine-DNA glycosylase